MKIRHGAVEDNVVAYVCAKFGDDIGYENEKALADRNSDNNNKNKKQ